MRRMVLTFPIIAGMLMSFAARSNAADPVACTVLTPAQVSAALGVSYDKGEPIARPGTCQWVGKPKFATLTIAVPRGGKSPVEQFNQGKKGGLGAVTVEPVSGVGDDAYYVYITGTTRAVGLVVKKGNSEFEVRVYGIEIDKAKQVAKTLAQEAAGKF